MGSTARGAQIAAETCAACHGDKGLSQQTYPALAGQTPEAIYKQLHDYRTGARVNAQMTPVAQALAVTDLANVAAYFAAASKEYTAIGARDLPVVQGVALFVASTIVVINFAVDLLYGFLDPRIRYE